MFAFKAKKVLRSRRRRPAFTFPEIQKEPNSWSKGKCCGCCLLILLATILGVIIGVEMIDKIHIYANYFRLKKVGRYGKPPMTPVRNNSPHRTGRGILSVVLPTHCSRFDAAELALESLAAYTEPKTFDELILISPERCPFKPTITKQLSSIFVSDIKSISDESLIPYVQNTNVFRYHWSDSNSNEDHGSTWHKQMILKLAIGHVVNSPFFLILDDDLLQINAASLQDYIAIQMIPPETHEPTNTPTEKDPETELEEEEEEKEFEGTGRDGSSTSQDDKMHESIEEQKAPAETLTAETSMERDQIIKKSANDRDHEMESEDTKDNSEISEISSLGDHDHEQWKLSLRANWVYDYQNWQVEWYQNTAKMMNAEHCMDEDDLTFGVTPAILSTTAVKSAVERMNKMDSMNGISGFWSEYAVYRVEFCLRKDFLTFHSKNPSLDFDKKLYTRYATELTESAEAIYSVDAAIDLMRQQRDNNNIFIVLQDGAVPDRIRELAWSKWIVDEFTDEERASFMRSRTSSNKRKVKVEQKIGKSDVSGAFAIDNLDKKRKEETKKQTDEWLNAAIWLRIVLAINVAVLLVYICCASSIRSRILAFGRKICCKKSKQVYEHKPVQLKPLLE